MKLKYKNTRFLLGKAASICLFLLITNGQAAAQHWIQLAPTGTPPAPRGFHGTATVYDPASNRMIVFGGRLGSGTNTNDVWVLINAIGLGGTPQWINLIADSTSGSPPARSGHSAVYDPTSNRMIVFGGCNGYCFPTLNDVWVLTNANGLGGTPTWIQLSPTGGFIFPRTRQAAVYDPATNRMIVFAGQSGGGFGCDTFADVWVLSNANGLGGSAMWTQLTPTGGPPPGQYGPSAVYDSASNQMTVFGGGGFIGGSCQNSSAVWVLSNANGMGGTPSWTNLISEGMSGSAPARAFHTAVYDAATNRMTVFGGNNLGGTFDDVWALSHANGRGGASAWMQLAPTGEPPPARESHGAVFDTATKRMVVFGGDNNNGFLNDIWVLTDTVQFDICLQDDSSGDTLRLNSTTGDYQFTSCRTGFTLMGTGMVNKKGALVALQDNQPDRRVLANVNNAQKRGNATIKVFSQGSAFTIIDKDTTTNTCACP